ncbi:sodium:proton exchanger [Chakrabartia godavariana]|nr:sodium:proton exchanger [Chakrabartia godavariana]
MTADTSTAALHDALLILGAAGVVIPAFARVRITPVIGFILIGILTGPYGLARFSDQLPWLRTLSIADRESIEPFAELGIILLLFSIGLELSFARLKSMRRLVFGIGAAQLFGSGVLIGLALWAFGGSLQPSLGLGVALALSSTALVLPISGTTGAVGRNAFGMLLFEDLALVPIVFLLGSLGGAALADIANMAGLLGTGLLTLAAMFILGRFLLPPLFAQAARTKSPELFISATLLVVIASSMLTVSVGLSPIMGALVAGLLIAETAYRSEVETVVIPFKGLALGVFLITVGMRLDIDRMVEQWAEVAVALIGVLAIKMAVTAGLLRLNGVRRGVAAEVGVLMASPSETTLIVLAAALQAGLISEDISGFWQVVTALGLTITPLLARLGHVVAGWVESRHGVGRDEPAIDENDMAPRAIIVGYGRVGRMVADMLDTHGRRWVAIEGNVDTVNRARREGRPVRFGDATRLETLEGLGLSTCPAIVMTMDDHVQAVRLTKRIRQRHAHVNIVARARDPEHAAELYKAGASDAVPETLESSLQLSEAVLVDLGVAMGPVIASIHEKRDELRGAIKHRAGLKKAPKLGTTRK